MILQTKQYFLRLNVEQIQHIFDGLVENRNLIDKQHLVLYDEEVQDLVDQMASQDIEIQLNYPESPIVDEGDMAYDIMQDIYQILESNTNNKLKTKIDELDKLLFG